MNSSKGRGHEDDALWDEALDIYDRYRQVRSEFMTWNIGIGPLRTSRPVGTNTIALAFLGWHALTLTAGIVITVAWPVNRALGIALTVGSLFGIGSFIAQVWSQGMTREREFIHKIEAEEPLDRLRIISKEVRDIERRIEQRMSGDE